MDSSMVSGKWKLSKHTITKKGIIHVTVDNNRTTTYEFMKNGTYRLVDKTGKIQVLTKGKWKVTQSGTKVHLYTNEDVPNDPKVEIADHDLNIILLKGQYYLTYSWGDSQYAPETDYYKKTK